MNNAFLVVKWVIDDDGLRKDFSKRGRVPPKIPRRGRGVLLGGALIDKNDSEEQRQGTFPASHKHGPDEASISAAIVPGTQAPQAYLGMWRVILNTS